MSNPLCSQLDTLPLDDAAMADAVENAMEGKGTTEAASPSGEVCVCVCVIKSVQTKGRRPNYKYHSSMNNYTYVCPSFG